MVSPCENVRREELLLPVPFGLSREPHSRFATCVDDPIAVPPRRQRMQVLEKVEEVDVEDSELTMHHGEH